MNRSDLVKRVQLNVRDFRETTFRKTDIIAYINEGIDRLKQCIPELLDMKYLETDEDIPILFPPEYHHYLSIYSSARCFGHDERHYESVLMMNEFESKVEELRNRIYNGDIFIVNDWGEVIKVNPDPEYMKGFSD